jgi:hypothetical protein
MTEILALQWTWIDLDNGVIRLPDSKTRKDDPPVSTGRAVLDITASCQAIHVIVGSRRGASGQPRKAVAAHPQGGWTR